MDGPRCGKSQRGYFALPHQIARRCLGLQSESNAFESDTLVILTGTPFTTALPEASSTSRPGLIRLLFTPGRRLATRVRDPGRSCPQPWGRLTTPGRMPSVSSAATCAEPSVEVTH